MGVSPIRFLPLISLIQPLYRYGNLVVPALISIAMSVSEHLFGYLCEAAPFEMLHRQRKNQLWPIFGHIFLQGSTRASQQLLLADRMSAN